MGVDGSSKLPSSAASLDFLGPGYISESLEKPGGHSGSTRSCWLRSHFPTTGPLETCPVKALVATVLSQSEV